MVLDDVNTRGMVLLGCGKMGSALLQGWIDNGVAPGAVCVLDPHAPGWLAQAGITANGPVPPNPAVVVIAVKPQIMQDALPVLAGLGNGDTLFVSVAAGITLQRFEDMLGARTPIVRTIPNTPAAIGRGITAMVGNGPATAKHVDLARALLSAVGQVVEVETESQIDAVTAVSGSGPAYVFHMIECMAAAGEAEGLPPEVALQLARATVAGAGALAEQSGEDPGQLRRNVTSPNGTTQAALEVLMDDASGLPALMKRAVAAAAARSKELANG